MPESIPALLATHNPWLSCAVLFTLRAWGVGAAWSWLVTPDASGRVAAAAHALLTGLVLNAVCAALLGEAGLYAPWIEGMALAGLATAGLFFAGTRRTRHLSGLIPAGVVTFLVAATVMLVPHRGEWIGGGWDPGVYVNQGVALARTGGLTPPPDPLLSRLTPAELEAVTRPVHNYIEYLPVVPVDPETRQIEPFFFRLTPAWISVLFRCGGLRAATRVNLFTGAVSLLVFLALVRRLEPGRFAPALAVLFLAAQPVWLFMLHFPTSEMLQLVLVLGTLLLVLESREDPAAAALVPVLLFAALLNRLSFFPFAGLLLCTWAWIRPDTGRPIRLAAAAACAAAVLHDLYHCPVTVGRLDELVPPLLAVGTGLVVIAVAAPSTFWARLRPGLIAGLLAGVAVSLAAVDAASATPHLVLLRNLAGAMPFLNPGLLAAGGAGLGLILFRSGSRPARSLAIYLAACALVSFTFSAITSLYPWALRRHLVYATPLIAWTAASAFGRLGTLRPSPAWRTAVGIAALLLLLPSARTALHAVTRTELDGLSGLLADAAQHLEADDVVLADHFRWGTPLKFLRDAQVLNGELLWQDGSPERTRTTLELLRRLHQDGHRIVLFTSTELGPAVFPVEWGPLDLLWSSGRVTLRDLHHRPGATDFIPRSREKTFALHRWVPDTDPDPP